MTTLSWNSIIFRYNEIALKGKNRSFFETKLKENILHVFKNALDRENAQSTRCTRFFFENARGILTFDFPWEEKMQTLFATNTGVFSKVFGLSSWTPAFMRPLNPSELAQGMSTLIRALAPTDANASRTFRVLAKRSHKKFPLSSQQIERTLGSSVLKALPRWKVDLKHPQITLGIDICNHFLFFYHQKHPGPGGLPVSTQPKVLSLLSGGIDSPVATLFAMKRGTSTHLIHFYGTPFIGKNALLKIKKITQHLQTFHIKPLKITIIPFGLIQEKIAQKVSKKYLTIIYRRLMFRISEQVAKKIQAKALLTGENLGQVASQTLENIAVIQSVVSLPVLRPLLGFDKKDIIFYGKNWGTYRFSIEPILDCCTLFADQHPATRATLEKVEAEEKKFPLSELIKQGIKNSFEETYSFKT